MLMAAWLQWLQTNGQLVFTFVLVIANIALWLTTRRAVKVAEKQARTMHTQMLISIQPHVTPKLAVETEEEQPPPSVKFVNTGAVAYLASLALELDGISIERDLGRNILAPGGEHTIPVEFFDAWAAECNRKIGLGGAQRFDQLRHDVAIKYVTCTVQYQDQLERSSCLRFEYRGKRPDIRNVTVCMLPSCAASSRTE